MTRIQKRRGTAAEWADANPVLAEGEEGYESDTDGVKIGNGEDLWLDRPYTVLPNSGRFNAPYGADYWVDLANGDYRTFGTSVAMSALLTHNTTAGLGVVEVRPAIANKVEAFSGGVAGLVGSGGTIPTGWSRFGSGPMTLIAFSSNTTIEWSSTLDPRNAGGNDMSGIITPAYSGVDTGSWELSFDVILRGPAIQDNQLQVFAQWMTNNKGKTRVGTYPFLGNGRVTITLPSADVSSDSVAIVVENRNTTKSVDVQAYIGNITLHPSVSNKLWDANPSIGPGANTSRSATLNVPNGDYTIFAWTERGIRGANATASGGTGINLQSVFTIAKMYKIGAWRAGRYAPGMITDDPQFESVYATDNAALQKMQNCTAESGPMILHNPGHEYSLRRSTAFWARDRVEVRAGDALPAPDELFKRRAEVIRLTSDPFGTDIWMSFPFRVFGSLHNSTSWASRTRESPGVSGAAANSRAAGAGISSVSFW